MLSGCLPGPCSLWAVHTLQGSSASFTSFVLRQVYVCVYMSVCDTMSTLYMYCVSRSSQLLYFCASFEMYLIWIFMVVFFSCHDSLKHLHEMCGVGLWIYCLMGQLPYFFEDMDVFHCHICNVGYIFYSVCVSVWGREIRSFTWHVYCSLLLCQASTGVFALMQ